MNRARWWDCAGGWVRLALEPGKTMEWRREWPTEEGYFRSWIRWTHEGHQIVRETHEDGRDCDGRYESHRVEVCRLSELAAEVRSDRHGPPGGRCPNWRMARSCQRDHTAEAAGY